MASLTIDLHTHLLEKNVKARDYWKAVLRMGVDAIAITEHL